MTVLQPHHAPHWTNLSFARMRSGHARLAADAAREAVRLNPRFAKGWLRLGEALDALGEHEEAIETFEAGLQRAEGAVRLSLTKGLQRARLRGAPPASAPLGGRPERKASGGGGGGGGAATRSQPSPAPTNPSPSAEIEVEWSRSPP